MPESLTVSTTSLFSNPMEIRIVPAISVYFIALSKRLSTSWLIA